MASAEYSPAVLRTRPVATGHWRAFLAVAKHLNFRAAADELDALLDAAPADADDDEESRP